MKYLLSYASNPSVSSGRDNLYSRELIESSVRNLLNELADVICGNPVVSLPTPEQQQVSGYYGHTPRPLGKNIEMKKGAWICTRCNFMNFARNLQCLECEAVRPKRQLNGGEWECPQLVILLLNFEFLPNTGYQIRNSMGYQGIANVGQNVRYSVNDNNQETSTENQQIGWGNWSSNYSVNSEVPTTGHQIRNRMGYLGTNNDNQNVKYYVNDNNLSQTGPPRMGSPGSTTFNSQSRYPGRESAYQTGQPNDRNFSQNSPSTQPTSNSAGTTSNSPVNQNVRSGWSGKSLEGSTVKDPDPLDMSEEAKAERWFRRVAQIKDISELSQIPDEDFPSIMPMRKGVNRFVVSKRKTPLERRLTSPQYPRNLLVVSSDLVKDNDSS